MTREEIINEGRPDEPYCFESDKEEQWYKIGLYDGATANQWINIKEKRPENGQRVLIHTNFGYIVDVNFCMDNRGGYFLGDFEIIIKGDVDYWMPIPELPKGGEK